MRRLSGTTKLVSLAFVILLSLSSCARTSPVGPPDLDGLKRKVEEVASATRNGDYGKVVDSTYPKLVEQLGGRDKTLSVIENAMSQIKARGFEILSYSVGTPSDVQVINGQTFATVPTLLKLKAPGSTITSPSYMLGISSDGGQKWWLIDGSDLDEGKVKTLFPEASDKLVLPKRQPPEFTP